MISIVISTYRPAFLNNLERSIAETIGVPYEIIAIDNAKGVALTKVYNSGLDKAIYPIVLFSHEDVMFHTPNWGQILVGYFNTMPELGCVGIAGSVYKSSAPSSWWQTKDSFIVQHLIQHFSNGTKKYEIKGWEEKELYKFVSVLDGVFLAINKKNNLRFDESIPGFHCYDLDISIEALKKKLKVITTKEILLEHFSQGELDRAWIASTHKLHIKHKNFFSMKRKMQNTVEQQNYKDFIILSHRQGFKKIGAFHWLRFIAHHPFAKEQLELIKYFSKVSVNSIKHLWSR